MSLRRKCLWTMVLSVVVAFVYGWHYIRFGGLIDLACLAVASCAFGFAYLVRREL